MPPSLGRVLIVEDEPQVAEMLRDVLTSLGYESARATDGRDALSRMPTYRPDVVLLDLWMPGMPGPEVLDVLRRDYPDVPVIMVTANQDEEIARATLARGALDYVRKPFDIEALGRILEAALVYRSRVATPGDRAPGMIRGTVLYIDDDPANVLLVERLLEQRPGVRLITAPDGQRGLTLARERRPDLILLDLHLPDAEGGEVLRAVRADPDLARTPVIVLSAEAEPDLPTRMRAAGAQGYLLKPVAFPQFFSLVDAHLSRGGGPRR